MTLNLNMTMDNEAFIESPGAEAARILRRLADRYDQDGLPTDRKLIDLNGNTVGEVTITDDD